MLAALKYYWCNRKHWRRELLYRRVYGDTYRPWTIKVKPVVHTNECLEHSAEVDSERAAYIKEWPHYCRKCNGWGLHTYRENRAPFGCSHEPGNWMEDCSEPCDACIGHSRCPRCGRSWLPRLMTWRSRSAETLEILGNSIYDILRKRKLPKSRWTAERYGNDNSWQMGVKVDPWLGNVQRKLIYHAWRLLMLKIIPHIVRGVTDEHSPARHVSEGECYDYYSCPFCGWTEEVWHDGVEATTGLPEQYECTCWEEDWWANDRTHSRQYEEESILDF